VCPITPRHVFILHCDDACPCRHTRTVIT
jgi:hypothetical protein